MKERSETYEEFSQELNGLSGGGHHVPDTVAGQDQEIVLLIALDNLHVGHAAHQLLIWTQIFVQLVAEVTKGAGNLVSVIDGAKSIQQDH